MAFAQLGKASYGHLGAAHYDVHYQQWTFQRCTEGFEPFEELEGSVELISPSTAEDVPQISHVKSKHFDPLLARFRELVPASHLLPELALVSESVVRQTAEQEPLASELIAFGVAQRMRGSKKLLDKNALVTVFAGGRNGEAIHVALVASNDFRRGDVSLASTSVRATGAALWAEARSPVQQLCFSRHALKPGSHLAVRTFLGTTVLQPSYYYPSAPGTGSASKRKRGSACIDLQRVGTIDVELTGGSHHAFVSFDPWNEHRLVTFTTDGRWAVWIIVGCCGEFSGPARLFRTHSGFHGGLASNELRSSDGWGSAFWVGGPKYILTATRNSISVFPWETPADGIVIHSRDLEPESTWIQDVKTKENDLCLIVVLTSRRIFCLRLRADHLDQSHFDGPQSAPIIFSIMHHLDPRSPNLQLSLNEYIGRPVETRQSPFSKPSNVVMVCVNARGSNSVTGFYLEAVDAGATYRLLCDPFQVSTATDSGARLRHALEESRDSSRKGVSCLHLAEVAVSDVGQAGLSTRLPSSRVTSSAAFQILILHADLSVSSRLITNLRTSRAESGPVTRQPNEAPPESEGSSEQEDFVIPDSHALLQDFSLHDTAKIRIGKAIQQSGSDSGKLVKEVDLTWLAARLQQPELETLEVFPMMLRKAVQQQTSDGTVGPLTILEYLMVQSESSLSLHQALLNDLGRATMQTESSFSTTASHLLDTIEPGKAHDVFALQEPSSGSVRSSQELWLLRQYGADQWPPLPSHLVERPKAILEASIRQAVAHFALSSYALSRPPAAQKSSQSALSAKVAKDRTTSQDPRQQSSGLQIDFGTRSPPCHLPTPPHDHESTRTPRASSSDDASFGPRHLATLEHYATFTSKHGAQEDTVQRVLEHWPTGVDPTSFDWEGIGSRTEDVGLLPKRPKQGRQQSRSSGMGDFVLRQIRSSQGALSSQSQRPIQSSQASGVPEVLSSSRTQTREVPMVISSQSNAQSQESTMQGGQSRPSLNKTSKKKRKQGF